MNETQLATLKCTVERSLYGKSLSDTLKHRLIKYRYTVSARIFGSIHRGIGMAQQVICSGCYFLFEHGHTDAGRDKDITLPQSQWLMKRFEHHVCKKHSVALIFRFCV